MKLLCLLCTLTFVSLTRSFIVVPRLKQADVVPILEGKIFLRKDGFDDDSNLVPYISRRRDKLMLSSKVTVETTDAGSLQISIPRIGLQGSSIFDLGFTASWLGIIGYWTFGMVRAGAGPVGALFSVPFWLAGASMANKSIIDPATAVRLTIGVYGWSLEKTVLGSKTQTLEGPTWQLDEAVVDADMVVNGKPLTCIHLDSGVQVHSFGHALTTKEKEWVVMEINEWLKENDEEIIKAAQVIREGEI
jgi:hypothetical protein